MLGIFELAPFLHRVYSDGRCCVGSGVLHLLFFHFQRSHHQQRPYLAHLHIAVCVNVRS